VTDDPSGGTLEDERDGEPIPLSALQHAVYCLRQAALIHLERMWAENRFTAEGKVLHIAADKPGSRRIKGVRRVMALPLASKRRGIAGVADLVEFHTNASGAETPFPVEYKRGKPKLHRADEVQLCAQALCLEEMLSVPVPEGALFYALRRGTAATDRNDGRGAWLGFCHAADAPADGPERALPGLFAYRPLPAGGGGQTGCGLAPAHGRHNAER
jgi:CRISPR-associated protein Cas4